MRLVDRSCLLKGPSGYPGYLRMPSRKKAPRAWVPKLAPRWERIGRVRGRFRRNQPWLKLAKGPENHEIVQCTPSIGANYEILAGGDCQKYLKDLNCFKHIYHSMIRDLVLFVSIRPILRRPLIHLKVGRLYERIPYVPEARDQHITDGKYIRKMLTFAIRRQKDASRRNQVPRVSCLNVFHVITAHQTDAWLVHRYTTSSKNLH